MRTIHTKEIIRNIKEMCIEANHFLSEDMEEALRAGVQVEASPLGRQILEQLNENLMIAGRDQIPICQDTGMAVVFAEVGQDLRIEGGSLSEAIQEGVRQGYVEGFLRKSVVGDPLIRKNTGDNTPAIIHYDMVEGDELTLTVAPKGAGSENMSRILGIGPAGLGGTVTALAVNIETYPTHIACLPVAVNICCHVNRHARRIL